nr:MAG TPA: replicative helicase [Bacteriophage sp.]
MSKKKVIIFDDYGKGAVTDAYVEKMYYRLDSRIERGLRTIITTNLASLEEFKARDNGIASRLMMNADIYVCDTWKDRRISETRILNKILH